MSALVRVAIGFGIALLSTSVWLVAQAPPGPEAPDATTAQVTFLAGSSVYINAGRAEGLREGQLVEVVREGEVVATLTVTFLSTHRASCTLDDPLISVEVGDVVRFGPLAPAATPSPEVTRPGGARATARRPASGIRGRVGLRYLDVNDRGPADEGFTQPALDLRLDGRAIGGGPIDLAVDVRSRRTRRAAATGGAVDESRTRVYRLAATWNQGQASRLTLGRQYSPSLSAVSIFDGLMFDLARERWSVGVFSGTQPDASDFGWSSSIREHGAYFQVRGRKPGPRRWSWTTGIIGSYQEGEINREFLYLQGLFHGKRLSAHLAQEVDYNRGWKSDAGEATLDPTNSFVSLRYRVGRRVSFHGGYDNRRNVRLYRDLVTPVTDFDDTFRRGVWLGADLDLGDHFYTGVSARSSSGGMSGDADVYSGTLGVRGLTSWGLGVHSRSTSYTNDQTEGWLHSLSVGVTPGARLHVELTGGIRDDEFPLDRQLDTSLTWYGIDLEISLTRRLFLWLSAERSDGELEEYDQLYSSLSYRF